MSSGAPPLKRLIVCVDAAEAGVEGKSAQYATTIFRLKSVIHNGLGSDALGRRVDQTVKYYRAVDDGPSLLTKLRSKASNSTPYCEKQIKDIVKAICEILDDPKDELFLYGFGHGGFIVRAVAGVMHTMRLPKRASLRHFDQLYQNTLDVFKAKHEDDNTNGPRLVEFLTSHTIQAPRIQFLGAFETVKYAAEGAMHDLSFVGSIVNMRHAMALNESRYGSYFETVETPSLEEMEGRSLIRAWFVGSQHDIGGGTYEDGLSLYPLQWMIIESMRAGIVLESQDQKRSSTQENPLALVFPHFAGKLPDLDSEERIEWSIKHSNGMEIKMYDLQSVHGLARSDKDKTHAIHIHPAGKLYNSQRKIFGLKTLANGEKIDGLLGWVEAGPYGTIIHPSVFCLLDRYPRFYEQSQFKPLKKSLADYREHSLVGPEGEQPPWLEGIQLQASGVKAFRILVCGKTGVGKSTLINKVFGVEMTEESESYSQGVHDINQAFESPNHPGLMIHDSRGWQAGSDKELDLIAKFLRHRAFQKDPAQALHVIWFCVDSDVSRIEEADKRTFATIAQYSNHVPVFVIGTKKDKLVTYRTMKLLEKYMEESTDYKESKRLAQEEANISADQQFMVLRNELSTLESYRADGYCCLSKDDNQAIKLLITQTLDLISDDRVRLFCVAAQVMDVEQKIDSAITETMRLSTHAVRTAMVPLPFSGVIGTPTVSRILVEHILQCFGFPKALPSEIDDIMVRIVMKSLKAFMTVTLVEFVTITAVTTGLIVATMGAAGVLALAASALAAPPTARMLFKCACDMILILERSFRYGGKYVSVKQIEDAALYYTTTMTTTFAGKEKLLQTHVHDEIDRLIPLSKITAGIRFSRMRTGLEDIIYKNRFEKSDATSQASMSVAELGSREIMELDAAQHPAELENSPSPVAELPAEINLPRKFPISQELDTKLASTTSTSTSDDVRSWSDQTSRSATVGSEKDVLMSMGSPVSPEEPEKQSGRGSLFSRMSSRESGSSPSPSRNIFSKLSFSRSKSKQDSSRAGYG